MDVAEPNDAQRHEPEVAGPRPARPLRDEIGGALVLVYAPCVLGGLLAGVAANPELLGEFLVLLPFTPASFPAMIAASVWPALGLTGPAGTVAGYAVAAGLSVAMIQLARIVQRAAPPSRAFLQVSMAVALVIQAWLVVTLFIELG